MIRTKTAVVAATFTALLASSVAGRQLPPDRQPPPPAPMTITGCLKSGPNPSGVPAPVTYTLEPIEKAPAPPSPSRPAADEVAPSVAKRYTLTASGAVDFAAHVGHKVEMTGRLKDLSTPESAATRDPQKKPPQPGGAHNTFEVSALKMVSATCP
jgi:hypothetical protein